MGLYNDFGRDSKRDGWVFTYKGSELLPFAKAKHKFYYMQEKEARAKLTAFNADMKMSVNDEKVQEVKRTLETAGNQREKCAVWVHEFTRNADREYHLGLPDVTYFDIAPFIEEEG